VSKRDNKHTRPDIKVEAQLYEAGKIEYVHSEMADEAVKVHAAWLDEHEISEPKASHDELHDSEKPPQPQLRRARSTVDRSKRVKDKNTGIKGRDASGKKHARH
jgi:hypothetical protein